VSPNIRTVGSGDTLSSCIEPKDFTVSNTINLTRLNIIITLPSVAR